MAQVKFDFLCVCVSKVILKHSCHYWFEDCLWLIHALWQMQWLKQTSVDPQSLNYLLSGNHSEFCFRLSSAYFS
jgi:hypothetical protein